MTQTVDSLLSFVVPLKDEEKTIRELFEGISREVTALNRKFEVIFIDDGSTDTSWSIIQQLAGEFPAQVVAFRFRRNCGKADALAVGFEAARGDIVFTMDADLQDDPKEIGRFLEKLGEDYDIVSGWKKSRYDPWHKVLPSRIFNKMLSQLNGVELHDHNCGFKCYRAEVIKSLRLYGEMHRMIPSLGSIKGFRSAEIVVQHHPRLHGSSKYGIKRFLRGFMDMQTVYFLKHFRERPLHLFGGGALTTFILANAILALSFFPELSPLMALRLTIVAEGLAACAVPLMAFGFIGELLVHGRVEKERRTVVTEAIRSGIMPAPTLSKPVNTDNILVLPVQGNQADAPVVLVAEDELEIRALMRSHLEEAGFRVEEAANGAEMFSKLDDEIAVVLLDLAMPGKGGLDCIAQMRKRYAEVPIVVVSGNDEISTAVRAMKMGAFDYVTKPFGSRHLIDTVHKALKMRGLVNELTAESA